MRIALLALALVGGCGDDVDTGAGITTCDSADCIYEVTVIAVDESGERVAPDVVNWYFDPESAEYDGEHPLLCEDESCMSWVLEEAPGEVFYVSGSRQGDEHTDPYCGFSGYDGQPVAFDGEPVVVTLDLTLHEWCE